jgi:hypothetical protein
MVLHTLMVNWDIPLVIGRTVWDPSLLMAKRRVADWPNDAEHMVEMYVQGLYSGYPR